jgi:hypothetical protein
MPITLPELHRVVAVAADRQWYHYTHGTHDRHGYDRDRWTTAVESMGAELVVHNLLHRPWAPVCDDPARDRLGDVGPGVQVRWHSQADGFLFVRPTDPDDHVYIHVRGVMPNMEIVGCIEGHKAKRREWLTRLGKKDRPPVHAVPDRYLRQVRDDLTY